MTPAEMSAAMTASYYKTYAETVPRKWPAVTTKQSTVKHKRNRYKPEYAPSAKRLRAARKAKGMTLAQLGVIVGVTNATISKWEQAAYPITRDRLASLASALDVSVRWLMEGVE
jgi:DNA-binding transcriptional regulator YiaG